MSSVSINPPKTPVTKGSEGTASATLPNVCKMPGAPFVPTPLPNIGKSGSSPKNYTKTVTVEGATVAIRGASFGSQGDAASKGTGGGLISANTHGPSKFIGPGTMDVRFEGKSVHLLGEPMMNNCGPSGSPANAATLAGVLQRTSSIKSQLSAEMKIHCAIYRCDEDIKPRKGEKCKELGKRKHACMEHKLRDHEPYIYSETWVVMTTPPQLVVSNTRTSPFGGQSKSNIWQAVKLAKYAFKNYEPGKGFLRRPDVIFRDESGNLKIIDAKFPCNGNPKPLIPDTRKSAYEEITATENNHVDSGRSTRVESLSPEDIDEEKCPPEQ
ncbi:DUF4150 domain-containing protein [Pseudenhygromyxa sp. WMMC2535]|uniref:PAAR-like domain-containing protein n=1 Tax=Pseudenhygromyxa sp. WMMC2535 TaxID=2712867 RepID=UPI001556E2F0|nr:PAAR-like domain-containing protein [Pseudenhygromyxa sp. WMMC2535]NVB37717.1 DUF4150 domain-containing protein [Pseudenhygromyxa sp. WMMC2535]